MWCSIPCTQRGRHGWVVGVGCSSQHLRAGTGRRSMEFGVRLDPDLCDIERVMPLPVVPLAVR